MSYDIEKRRQDLERLDRDVLIQTVIKQDMQIQEMENKIYFLNKRVNQLYPM